MSKVHILNEYTLQSTEQIILYTISKATKRTNISDKSIKFNDKSIPLFNKKHIPTQVIHDYEYKQIITDGELIISGINLDKSQILVNWWNPLISKLSTYKGIQNLLGTYNIKFDSHDITHGGLYRIELWYIKSGDTLHYSLDNTKEISFFSTDKQSVMDKVLSPPTSLFNNPSNDTVFLILGLITLILFLAALIVIAK